MKGQCAKGQGGLLSFSALACRRVLKISLCSLKKKNRENHDACYKVWGGNPVVMPFKPHKIINNLFKYQSTIRNEKLY